MLLLDSAISVVLTVRRLARCNQGRYLRCRPLGPETDRLSALRPLHDVVQFVPAIVAGPEIRKLPRPSTGSCKRCPFTFATHLVSLTGASSKQLLARRSQHLAQCGFTPLNFYQAHRAGLAEFAAGCQLISQSLDCLALEFQAATKCGNLGGKPHTRALASRPL